jgi:dTDP-4-dehydrorhamnose reductase
MILTQILFTNMSKILITGANGQLGSEIKKLSASYSTLAFDYTDVDVLDITNIEAIRNYSKQKNYSYIINCAAFTAVDKAESDFDLAMKINRDAVANLATVASEINAVFIHVSTDYVFDGTSNKPLTEDLPTNPQSAYGRTKLEGELAALKYDKSLVIRTAWLYSTFGNNFAKNMLRYGAEREELRIVADQTGTPTYAEDLARAILDIVLFTDKNGVKPGIYHYSNEGVCSWFDFTWEIINFAKLKCKVNPINTEDYPLPAKRPAYSVFNKSKIKRTFNLEVPYWKTSLYKCLTDLNYSK